MPNLHLGHETEITSYKKNWIKQKRSLSSKLNDKRWTLKKINFQGLTWLTYDLEYKIGITPQKEK